MATAADLGIVNVKDYMVQGAQDDTQMFHSAIQAAESRNAPVYVPPGNYFVSQQLILNGVSLIGAGFAFSRIHCTKKLGAGVPYVQLNPNRVGSASSNKVASLSLLGPGQMTLGQRVSSCDGVSINDSLLVEDAFISGFDAGIVLNTPHGHASIIRAVSSGNYYNLYITKDNGDNLIFDCVFSGAGFASIANKSGIPVGGIMIVRAHLGVAPYGWYEEKGSVGNSGWLVGGVLQMCRFEGCGNGAIYSENWDAPGGAIVHDLRIDGTGFSWGPQFRLADHSWDYAVQVGGVFGTMVYVPGKNGFTPGNRGTWYMAGNGAQWLGFLNPADFVIGSGGTIHSQVDQYVPAPPAQGYHYVADRYWNSAPRKDAPAAWICTATGYTPTVWAPGQVYSGNYVVPTMPNGHIYATTYGRTGNTEPVFPTTPGALFYDNPPAGTTIWQPNTSYARNAVVIPPTFNGYYYTAQNADTSGSTQPTWPLSVHGQVNDNGIVWDAFPIVHYREAGTNIAQFEPFGTLGS